MTAPNTTKSKDLERLLAKPTVHEQWEADYRGDANERFYERAFDYLVARLGAPADASILDAGCGPAAHTSRLARRGFRVTAIDFSESILADARANVARRGLEDRVTFQRANLLELRFADGSFPYVLCWGVLMHIPEVAVAVGELARVLAPNGTLVVSEPNMRSPESRLLRTYHRVRGRGDQIERTDAGVEYWRAFEDGRLVTRHTDLTWLTREFQRHGCHLNHRAAGQLTELYSTLDGPVARRILHGLNVAWFAAGKIPQPAFANLLFFRKNPG